MSQPVSERGADAPAKLRQPSLGAPGRRTRSALLADAFLPHAGGSRVYYYNLYRRLSSDFNHSLVVQTTRTPGSAEFDAEESSPIFKIVRRRTPLPDWRIQRAPRVLLTFFHALRLKLSGRAELLHAGDLFPQGLACVWIKALFGTPYLIYAHGEEITQTDRFRHQPKLRDLIYRRADAVIAANDFAREQLLRIGVEEARIHTIYPGVDSVRFFPAAPEPAKETNLSSGTSAAPEQKKNKIILLSVGRLVPHKGHRILLDAIASLPATTARPRYLIAGEGPERRRLLARAAELGLSEDVTFLGKVSEAELPGLYNLCDLFALANREHLGCVEGFGMVFLEAGACGKPVLAGRTGGTSGAVVDGQTGLMFDPEDLSEVTAALNLLLSNAELRGQMGRAGRDRAAELFSWDRSAQRLNEVCTELIAGCPNHSRSRRIQEMVPHV